MGENETDIIFVAPVAPGYKLEGEVWVVFMGQVSNWWLFDWIGAWMAFRLRRAKGKTVFWGRLTKVLLESKKLHRNQLTVFNFQSKKSLLDLIKSKLSRIQFEWIRSATTDATAGLSTNAVDNLGLQENAQGKVRLVYMVHVFETNELIDLEHIKEKLIKYDIFVHFAGLKSAFIGYEDQGKRTVPFDMSGVLVLAAFEEVQFTALLNSQWFEEVMGHNQDNFSGIFIRDY
ncbi:MAG: hypothetical protein OCD76_12880 [Reichenbachiella sp.]